MYSPHLSCRDDNYDVKAHVDLTHCHKDKKIKQKLIRKNQKAFATPKGKVGKYSVLADHQNP